LTIPCSSVGSHLRKPQAIAELGIIDAVLTLRPGPSTVGLSWDRVVALACRIQLANSCCVLHFIAPLHFPKRMLQALTDGHAGGHIGMRGVWWLRLYPYVFGLGLSTRDWILTTRHHRRRGKCLFLWSPVVTAFLHLPGTFLSFSFLI
jgi:hypothetical protein